MNLLGLNMKPCGNPKKIPFDFDLSFLEKRILACFACVPKLNFQAQLKVQKKETAVKLVLLGSLASMP